MCVRGTEKAQPVCLGRSAEPKSNSSGSPWINSWEVNACSRQNAEKSANTCAVNPKPSVPGSWEEQQSLGCPPPSPPWSPALLL